MNVDVFVDTVDPTIHPRNNPDTLMKGIFASMGSAGDEPSTYKDSDYSVY